MSEPPGAPQEPVPGEPANWAQIALEAAQGGFGVPDASANADNEAPPSAPPRVPLRPGARRERGRRATDSTKEKARKSPSPLPPYREGMFVQPLTELYGFLGMGIMAFDPMCGTAVITSAEQCAVSLDKLAKQNHAVRRVLVAVTQTSALSAVVAAHMPILMAVVLHHVPGAQNLLGTLGARLMEGMMRQAQAEQEQEQPAA